MPMLRPPEQIETNIMSRQIHPRHGHYRHTLDTNKALPKLNNDKDTPKHPRPKTPDIEKKTTKTTTTIEHPKPRLNNDKGTPIHPRPKTPRHKEKNHNN